MNPTPSRKMNVKLAAQVLSHRTAAALRSCSEHLPASSERTAETVELFNEMFDFLNSNNLAEVGSRRPALVQLWATQQQVRIMLFFI